MAIVRIPDERRTLTHVSDVTEHLARAGIEHERWPSERSLEGGALSLAAGAPANEVLSAYAREIEALKARGDYVTADVIDVDARTPNLDAMLAKFNREHWHDEDEVRFILEGHGLFHIHPVEGAVFAIEVGAGDLLRVPRGTRHWFDLCSDRRIRAIRLFQDPSGWTPRYTESGVDARYAPVCLGPEFIPEGPASSGS